MTSLRSPFLLRAQFPQFFPHSPNGAASPPHPGAACSGGWRCAPPLTRWRKSSRGVRDPDTRSGKPARAQTDVDGFCLTAAGEAAALRTEQEARRYLGEFSRLSPWSRMMTKSILSGPAVRLTGLEGAPIRRVNRCRKSPINRLGSVAAQYHHVADIDPNIVLVPADVA